MGGVGKGSATCSQGACIAYESVLCFANHLELIDDLYGIGWRQVLVVLIREAVNALYRGEEKEGGEGLKTTLCQLTTWLVAVWGGNDSTASSVSKCITVCTLAATVPCTGCKALPCIRR